MASPFPRSEIIQNLSVLISSIESIIRQTNGNYIICNQARKMLQAILDAVLSPPPPPLPPQQAPNPPPAAPLPTPKSAISDHASDGNPMSSIPNSNGNLMSKDTSNGTGTGANNHHHVNGEINDRPMQQPQQPQMADAAFDNNAFTWLDDMNFDLDFWNSLEDHPLLAWPEAA